MRLSAFLTTILLAASGSAATLATSPPFEITNMQLRKVAGGNVTLSFTVYDPDPLTNAIQNCSRSWKSGSGDYPKDTYAICDNSTFAWNMHSFTSIRSFVLGLEHAFVDPAVGKPPYDEVTNFGFANCTQAAIQCKATSGLHVCQQDETTTIIAPIYATTAKRR